MHTALIVAIILISLVGYYVLSIYNKLIALKDKAQESMITLETQIKKKYTLVTSLIETLKDGAYCKESALDATVVMKAKNIAAGIKNNVDDKAKAERVLSGELKTLFDISKNDLTLKANECFLEFQREFIYIENKIQASYRAYNSSVYAINIRLELFPYNVIGHLFNLEKQSFFQTDIDIIN